MSELFVDIFGSVVATKKGGKKEIIYVVSNSYVILNFYLERVCKHKWAASSDVDRSDHEDTGDGTMDGESAVL